MAATAKQKKRLIIDTDPGIDDSMAIACAFNSPEVEIIGLTSIFGNVHTPQATQNCFFLLDMAQQSQVSLPSSRSIMVMQFADWLLLQWKLNHKKEPEPQFAARPPTAYAFKVSRMEQSFKERGETPDRQLVFKNSVHMNDGSSHCICSVIGLV